VLIALAVAVCFAKQEKTIHKAKAEATSACITYLRENGRVSKNDIVVKSTYSDLHNLLEIKFVPNYYSTEQYRNRNMKYDSCIFSRNILQKAQSDQDFEARIKPFIEYCVTNYRVELQGQQGWHARMKKYRSLTELEKQEERLGWCKDEGVRQLHQVSQVQSDT
jgi:hypothetical protein